MLRAAFGSRYSRYTGSAQRSLAPVDDPQTLEFCAQRSINPGCFWSIRAPTHARHGNSCGDEGEYILRYLPAIDPVSIEAAIDTA